MIYPIIKQSKDLTLDELKELNAICRAINSCFAENHVEENHIKKTNPIFYLFKVNEKIVAFHAFSVFLERTPFSKKKIPIIYINLSFKRQGFDAYIKNYAKWSNAHFLKQQIGRFWFLRKFILIFLTNNPKLAERSSEVFYQSYPSYHQETPNEILHFCSTFVTKNLKLNDTSINHNLVLKKAHPYKMDISSKWETLYKSHDTKQNEFFLQEQIINSEDTKAFLTGNLMLFLGENSCINLIKNILLLKLRKAKNPYQIKKGSSQ
ncbi:MULTISPECIES: hypothetical protein [unclassified Aureispira]|uniref:hypothetical protein n=1 Tax=unclassified Aureispira TaxID=2649989 RepID=UPI00069783AC|nr:MULTISPECIES: hypothetical protein [unclassified Aureispira]WMX13761.1 hypothetical protein QP953_23200 [Aureispira sp. CCB-E]